MKLHAFPFPRVPSRLVLFWVLLTAASAAPCGRADTFWHPEIAPAGPLVMVVSLDEQQLYVYRNGALIGASPVSSGKPGYETPTGIYTILQKEREHRSNLYDDAPMPYMQRLTWDGVAMHAGVLPGHAASHGCIRLPTKFAGDLFAATRRGDVVVVADAQVAPGDVVHPATLAPIDFSGEPMTLQDGAQTMPLPADLADTNAPLGIIVSTHDRTAYVLRDGKLVAHAPVTLAPDTRVHGMLLYVMEARQAGETDRPSPMHRWTSYRVLGTGPVPSPSALAQRIQLPRDFGEGLRAALRPGTTVLVTDLPGVGRASHQPYGALLQSGGESERRR